MGALIVYALMYIMQVNQQLRYLVNRHILTQPPNNFDVKVNDFDLLPKECGKYHRLESHFKHQTFISELDC